MASYLDEIKSREKAYDNAICKAAKSIQQSIEAIKPLSINVKTPPYWFVREVERLLEDEMLDDVAQRDDEAREMARSFIRGLANYVATTPITVRIAAYLGDATKFWESLLDFTSETSKLCCYSARSLACRRKVRLCFMMWIIEGHPERAGAFYDLPSWRGWMMMVPSETVTAGENALRLYSQDKYATHYKNFCRTGVSSLPATLGKRSRDEAPTSPKKKPFRVRRAVDVSLPNLLNELGREIAAEFEVAQTMHKLAKS